MVGLPGEAALLFFRYKMTLADNKMLIAFWISAKKERFFFTIVMIEMNSIVRNIISTFKFTLQIHRIHVPATSF